MENFAVEITIAMSSELLFRSLLIAILFILQLELYRQFGRTTLVLILSWTPLLVGLISDYHNFVLNVGRRSLLPFYAHFLNQWMDFYFIWEVVFGASLITLLLRKPK